MRTLRVAIQHVRATLEVLKKMLCDRAPDTREAIDDVMQELSDAMAMITNVRD